jgi:hypothetical protein
MKALNAYKDDDTIIDIEDYKSEYELKGCESGDTGYSEYSEFT